jgi:hypothetical protein
MECVSKPISSKTGTRADRPVSPLIANLNNVFFALVVLAVTIGGIILVVTR